MEAVARIHRTEARIRQLCCLGLGSETIMPMLSRELHELIPVTGINIFWLDSHDEVVNMYDDQPEALHTIAPLYFSEFHGKPRECEVIYSVAEAARSQHGLVGTAQAIKVSPRAFERSDFYNLVLRPLGYGTLLRLVLRESGRTRAILQLNRPLKERDFTPAQRRSLAGLEPFLVQALAGNAPADTGSAPFVDAADRGMIIASRTGQPLRFSPQAHRLLLLAMHPKIQSARSLLSREQLPRALVGICRNLCAATDCIETPAPVFRHTNEWGQFTFRAYWLDEPALGEGRIGISISRQVPLALGLLQGTRNLPLSHRQSEVAVLLASGLSHQQAADRLGLARDTVISHSRWVYNKLDVHDRDTLRERLLDAQYAMA